MAVTSIWRVNGWLGKLVIYVENPEKTDNPSYVSQGTARGKTGGLEDVIQYAMSVSSNDIILVDGIIDDLLHDQNLPDKAENRGKVFERFAMGELLKNYDLNEKEINNGLVDGQDDGGIDGFYIFINGNPVLDAADYTWPKRCAELSFFRASCSCCFLSCAKPPQCSTAIKC